MKLLPLVLCLATVSASASTQYFASPVGGTFGGGAVYQIHGNQRTVIYDFPFEGPCLEGTAPASDIVPMPDGSLIGVTSAGGQGYNGSAPGGVIFRLTQMSDSSWTEEVLYDFCPWFADCTHYGVPTSIVLTNPNMLEGLIQTPDGTKGVWWSFKLENGVGGSTWTSHARWGD